MCSWTDWPCTEAGGSVIKHVVQLLHDFIDTFTALVDFVDYLFSSVKPQYLLDCQHKAFVRLKHTWETAFPPGKASVMSLDKGHVPMHTRAQEMEHGVCTAGSTEPMEEANSKHNLDHGSGSGKAEERICKLEQRETSLSSSKAASAACVTL